MYTSEIRSEVSQGDVFNGVPIAYVTFNEDCSDVTTRIEYVRAIMLTYSCDFDKPNSHFVIFAQVRPLSEIPLGSQGNVREGKVRNLFYLPALEDKLEESYVDFRRIDRVSKIAVKHIAETESRLCSLSDEAVEALRFNLAVFFGVDRG